MWSSSSRGDATIDARKEILIEQRERLTAKMNEMQASLDRLNQKINGYEKVLAAERQLLNRRKEKK